MPPTAYEQSLLLHPLVPDSLMHNNRTLSNIRSISGLLLGISAGVLGLESLNGFLFYLIGSSFVSLLVHFILAEGQPDTYFAGSGARSEDGKRGHGAWREVWLGGGLFTEALSGFVLGWAGVGGVVRGLHPVYMSHGMGYVGGTLQEMPDENPQNLIDFVTTATQAFAPK